MAAYDYPLLIQQLLATPVAQRSVHEVVYRDRVRMGYPALVERIRRLGGVLARLGARMGTRVAFMDWDSHRYLEAYFAVPSSGAVLLTVNWRLSPDQVAYTIDHAEAEILFAHADFLPLLRAIRPRLPRLRAVVCLADDGAAPGAVPGEVDWAGEYEALLRDADPGHGFADFDERTVATTFYTTGTTGAPKGVQFTHRQIVLHTLSVLGTMGMGGCQGRLSREDVYMPLTPMFHVHAWGFPFVATLAGMKQVYCGRYEPAMILRLLAAEGATFSHCVPTILHMVLAAPDSPAVDLSGWKVVVGGSALPRGLALEAMRRGIDVVAGYGMSETCPIVTLSQVKAAQLDGRGATDEATVDVRTRAGLPAPLVQVRVVDEAMRDVPPGAPGEVVLRTPFLTTGYSKDAAATERLWDGGWMHTGDIGLLDGEGYLHVVDRLKDVIKSGGEWVSSIEVEDVLSRHPDVAEAAVIGVADARWGERPLALVVPRDGGAPDAAALRAHVMAAAESGALSRYAVPDRVLLVDSIEKTSVGKLDKKALRQRYAGTGDATRP